MGTTQQPHPRIQEAQREWEAAWWLVQQMAKPNARGAVVGRSYLHLGEVVVPALLATRSAPAYSRARPELRWPNGSVVYLVAVSDLQRLRGYRLDAAWSYVDEHDVARVFDELALVMRPDGAGIRST